jgi:hypothetical protein
MNGGTEMTRDNNPDRLDDGARAEAEMKERAGDCEHCKDYFGKCPYCHSSRALPAPQGDEGLGEIAASLADMVKEWVDGGIKFETNWHTGLQSIIEGRLSRILSPHLRSQASEIAGLKLTVSVERQKIEYRDKLIARLESRLASAMEALAPEAYEACMKICRAEASKVADTNADRYWQSKRIEGAIRSALASPAPAGRGVEGWRPTLTREQLDALGYAIVPKEPTETMLDAYWHQCGESKEMRERTHAYGRRYYQAMLAAAPIPENRDG